jgi:hypothetical protein
MGRRMPLARVRAKLKNVVGRFCGKKFAAILDRDYKKDFSRYPFLIDKMCEFEAAHRNGRPAYAWGVITAADQAKAIGLERISVLEFGVASGKGLRALELAATFASDIFGIGIDVVGFDSGCGLPKPKDFRDLPNLWSEGCFPMDRREVEGGLRHAKLLLGDVRDTVPEFLEAYQSPVGFISFDLDLYSSTMDAFRLFDACQNRFLPRVSCYFDDIYGWTYGDCNGELLAIAEFNKSHERVKISRVYGLRWLLRLWSGYWPEQMFLTHFFDNEMYAKNDGLNQARFM